MFREFFLTVISTDGRKFLKEFNELTPEIKKEEIENEIRKAWGILKRDYNKLDDKVKKDLLFPTYVARICVPYFLK